MNISITELGSIEILRDLPEDILGWLKKHGELLDFAKGESLFSRGVPANFLYIVVDGLVHRYDEIDKQWILGAITASGEVTGMLPFSRMTHYPSNAVAAAATRVIRLHKKDFLEMLNISMELGQRLVAEMSNRVRGGVRMEQQREKLISLGKLSAGLAHELNNPAAAIRRTAANLENRLDNQSKFIRSLLVKDMGEDYLKRIESVIQEHAAKEVPHMTALERSNAEEELTGWLENKGIAEFWHVSSIFNEHGIKVHHLENMTDNLPNPLAVVIVKHVAEQLEIELMINEIGTAAEQISQLISSVKRYSHLDRSSEHKLTDIRPGLEDTLKIYAFELNRKKIKINKDFRPSLPAVLGNAGELNQVWTCLIDNAIDAMEENGQLTLQVSANQMHVEVNIIDNGTGISETILPRVFDPFFTTKGVGEGTGLGLDIAQRIVRSHKGQIQITSQPGRTEVLVLIPVAVDGAAEPGRKGN